MFASFHKHMSLFLFFFFLIHLQINGAYFSMTADDSLALMAIKSEIKHDPQGFMLSWNESIHFCQWPGVICGRRHRRVTALDLSSKGLVGSLSPYIGNMSFLRDIQLQNNTFEGRIPSELGRLRRLEVLRFTNNSFEGEIPSNLSRCSHLMYLKLGGNKLVGRIPREFSSLIMLTTLYLDDNTLTGRILPFIGNLTSLQVISFMHNKLGGIVPDVFHQLKNLQRLFLNVNDLVGTIPPSFGNLTSLQMMSLSYNQLGGTIPNAFLQLKNLQFLYLDNNDLVGTIPPFFGNLTSLQDLSFAYNQLGGTVPDVFYQLKNLQLLSLVNNDLVGTIPPSIYHLPLLEALDIQSNRLQGSLPENIGSMLPLLQFFSVNDNRFSGPLPPSISNLTHVETIQLGGNNFTGKIAINFGGLQKLSFLTISETSLGSGEADEMKFIDSLSNCSSLKKLEVSYNQLLTGVLPASLGNLSEKLQLLNLDSNFLYGSIPSSIGNLIGLTGLVLSANQFTGIIPTSIGKLQNLKALYVDYNDFSGEIPGCLGNLSALLKLEMSHNRFEGNIPSSLGRCRNLLELSLYQNKLSGSIPRELFSSMPLSISLDLDWNNLSGPLPPEVGNLKGTSTIYLNENNLSGELPSSLASCTSLESLYLNMNSFQGSIPKSFRSLRALLELDLSCNNFSGHIPSFLEDIPLQYLNLSFNNFEGEIPARGIFTNSSALSIVGNTKLCGGMPELGLPKCRSKKDQKETRHKSSLAIILSATIFATLAGATIVSFFLFRWCTKKKKHQPSPSSLKESLEKVSYKQLLKATQGFSPTNLIGAGGFASVYRGMLGENGGVNIAVKVVNLGSQGGPKSFVAECEALRKIRHRNLVKVITCCSSVDFQGNDFKAIIFEYMENGSLERWLRSSTDPEHGLHYLSLRRRISVANDVACALDYLHHHCGETIVHCDLKPSNILFDGDMVSHVGDFGLAKFLLPGVPNPIHSSSIGIRGTIGYAAPEYGLGNEVSTKGDVYSFGILLLEMVTGKKPTDPMFQEGLNLHRYANTALVRHRVLDIVDPTIMQDDGTDAATTIVRNNESIEEATDYKGKEECCTLLVRIGVACSVEGPEDRMDITNVIHELKSLCKYQF